MNGAQALVEMLIRYDTKVVFGLPGDTSIDLYDALRAQASCITHVMARDERSAAFMADVYARLTGKPGICEGPSGGGATYMVPGVAEANGSSVALIALTTDNPLGYEAQEALTSLDQSRIYASITKWTALVKNGNVLPRFIRRAFRVATSGRPGAVHLTLPKDILAQRLDAPVDMHIESACRTWPAYRTRPAADSVSRVARLLLDSQTPVIVAGGGAVSSGAYAELLALSKYLGAPVATTINGKGAIAETSPLSLGTIGANGARPYANQIVQEADLVLLVGAKVNYVDSDSWQVPSLAKPPIIVQIDIEPSAIGSNYPVEEGLCADAKYALADVYEALQDIHKAPPDKSSWLEHIARLKEDWEFQAEEPELTPYGAMSPRRVIRELEAALPEEAILICDPGTPTPYIAADFELRRSGRWIIMPRAQGGLGYAIPGVAGARLARPESPVVGLCGDGSFAMSAGDLATIARLGGPTVLVLFNNGCYGWIKALQKFYCGNRYFSVDFPESLDYVAIATGFGLRSARVQDPSEIAPVVREALSRGSPFCIEVATCSEHQITPPVASWQRIEAGERQGESRM